METFLSLNYFSNETDITRSFLCQNDKLRIRWTLYDVILLPGADPSSKLIGLLPLKNTQIFMKPKTLLPLPEQPNTCPFPDRIESTPFRPIHSM
jgi:hypothetical protein